MGSDLDRQRDIEAEGQRAAVFYGKRQGKARMAAAAKERREKLARDQKEVAAIKGLMPHLREKDISDVLDAQWLLGGRS